MPVTAFAGGHNIFPAIGAAPGGGQYMVAGEFVAAVLLAAVEAAVIVPAEQCAVARWRVEIPGYPALYCHDGLTFDA